MTGAKSVTLRKDFKVKQKYKLCFYDVETAQYMWVVSVSPYKYSPNAILAKKASERQKERFFRYMEQSKLDRRCYSAHKLYSVEKPKRKKKKNLLKRIFGVKNGTIT